MTKKESLDAYPIRKIEYKDLVKDSVGRSFEFPKYTTQLINLANQNSGGTRPNVVGQMSDLINLCPEKSINSWRDFYLNEYPNGISDATDKIVGMISNLNDAMQQIDRDMVEAWVSDLIINKTAEGLIIQGIIIEYIANELKLDWRLSTKEEESKNIDGYIGETAIQIKPESYKAEKPIVKGCIDVKIIFYKKTDKYLTISTDLL